jgi:transcriptional regulator with XRE-family HTH domain
MKFGKRLQELREKAGMTQKQLAESSGLPLGSIRNYEQGYRDPLWQAVFKLADALGVDCRAFKDCLDGEDKPASTETEATPAAKAKKGSRKKKEN